jgi:hypothetical protein
MTSTADPLIHPTGHRGDRYKTLPVNGNLLCLIISKLIDQGVHYNYGRKAWQSIIQTSDISSIDCSGLVNFLLRRTANELNCGYGSAEQSEWCENSGFKKTDYRLHARLRDNRLRIAFMSHPSPHVWLILNGRTLESHTTGGVNRRWWNTPILLANVEACYVLTEPLILESRWLSWLVIA